MTTLATVSMLLAPVLFSVPASAVPGGEGFRDLSFEEACERAKAEEKIIFIDFFTTWCGPCKMMDKTTFQDPDVVAWLTSKTIALKVDAEANTDLAKRFHVKAYPTFIYARPDGSLLDRVIGYRKSEDFLEIGASVEAGKSSVDRAREALAQGDTDDPLLHSKLAAAYRGLGQNEEALREYLWCFDEGAVHQPSYEAVRMSFLLGDIVRFGRDYPPAKTALIERLDAARERIVAGGESVADSVRVFVRINDAIGRQEDTLAFLDQCKESEHLAEASEHALVEACFEPLMEAGRYDDVVTLIDVPAKVDQEFELYELTAAMGTREASFTEEQRDAMAEKSKSWLRQKVVTCYQALIGARRYEEAARVADRLTAMLEGAATLNSLAWAGYLTGSPVEANAAQARKAVELTEGEALHMVDTLARVLFALGQHEEAVSVARRGLESATSERDRKMLSACLEDFQRAGAK